MFSKLERSAEWIAKVMAWAGGAALIAVTVMSCLSIIGRAGGYAGLGLTSIRGDTEWVEMGTGFVVFAFLPWCTLKRGHASVDLFQPVLGRLCNLFIDLVADLLMFSVACLIAWRLWLGLLDKKGYGETTFILRAELWQSYSASMVGAVIFALIAGFCVIRSGRALVGSRA